MTKIAITVIAEALKIHLTLPKYQVAQKTSQTFLCIMQQSSKNKFAEKHKCNGQTSSNMCRNSRLKHFQISRDKKQNSVSHHEANYASGLSFMLPPQLHQNVTVGQIISQLISRKCAE